MPPGEQVGGSNTADHLQRGRAGRVRRCPRPGRRTAVGRGSGRRGTESPGRVLDRPGRRAGCTSPAPASVGAVDHCVPRSAPRTPVSPGAGNVSTTSSGSPPRCRRSARAARSGTCSPGLTRAMHGLVVYVPAVGRSSDRQPPPPTGTTSPVAWLYQPRSGLPATHLRDTKLAPAVTVTLAGSVQYVPVSRTGVAGRPGRRAACRARSSTGDDAPIVLVMMSPARTPGSSV